MAGTYTFAEFKDMLKLELGETEGLDSHSSLGNLLGKWVNSAYIYLTTRYNLFGSKFKLYFPELEDMTTGDTVDGNAYISTPSSTFAVRSIYDQTSNVRLHNISLNDYMDYPDRADTDAESNPTEWVRHGTYIYLHPTPDAVYTLEVWRRKIPDVLTGTDSTAIGPEWDDIILKIAVVQSLIRLKQYEEASFHKQELADLITGIVGIYTSEETDRRAHRTPDQGYYDYEEMS